MLLVTASSRDIVQLPRRALNNCDQAQSNFREGGREKGREGKEKRRIMLAKVK